MAGTIDTGYCFSTVREGWYKETYEGVESLQNFGSREELEFSLASREDGVMICR
jgi:hypothetical protein